MQNVISFIFFGLVVYLMFIRKGGMGCCGGHEVHKPESNQNVNMGKSPHGDGGDVIDLRKDEYTILPAKNERTRETK
jgi:hypothetical protein